MKFIPITVLMTAAMFLTGNIVFADITWNLGGAASTGYDSNITSVKDNPISDMVSHLSVGAGVTHEGKNDFLVINAGLIENIFTEHSSFNNLEEKLNVDYMRELSPYEHVKVKNTFSHSQEPRGLEDAFGRANGRYSTYRNDLKLGYERNITKQWTAKARYLQANYIYTRDDLSNSVGYNPGISVEYAFSSKAQASINYDYKRRSFDPGGSANTHTPALGWRQYLNPKWYVDLLGGVDVVSGFNQSYTKPLYAAGLTNDVDENTQLRLNFAKHYEADPYTQDIFDDWRVSLSGSRRLTDRIRGDISAFYGEGEYAASRISNKLRGASINLQYALNDHADVTLGYGHQNTTSNSSGREYTRDTIFSGVGYKF